MIKQAQHAAREIYLDHSQAGNLGYVHITQIWSFCKEFSHSCLKWLISDINVYGSLLWNVKHATIIVTHACWNNNRKCHISKTCILGGNEWHSSKRIIFPTIATLFCIISSHVPLFGRACRRNVPLKRWKFFPRIQMSFRSTGSISSYSW